MSLRGTTLAVLVSACAPELPSTPSFQTDILPALAGNCVRCHGVPPIGGAPAYFRLDAYETVVLREATLAPEDPACTASPRDPRCDESVLYGAADLAISIALRSADEERPMPPRFPLDGHQIDLLERWAEEPGRGPARPGNRPPRAALAQVTQAPARVDLVVLVDDDDGDLASGVLRARRAGQDLVIGLLHAGRATVAWDTAGVPAGIYQLVARLDDGAAAHEQALGALTIGGAP